MEDNLQNPWEALCWVCLLKKVEVERNFVCVGCLDLKGGDVRERKMEEQRGRKRISSKRKSKSERCLDSLLCCSRFSLKERVKHKMNGLDSHCLAQNDVAGANDGRDWTETASDRAE